MVGVRDFDLERVVAKRCEARRPRYVFSWWDDLAKYGWQCRVQLPRHLVEGGRATWLPFFVKVKGEELLQGCTLKKSITLTI